MLKKKRILVVGEFNSKNKVYTYATSFYNSFKTLGYESFKFNCKQNYLKLFGNMHYHLPVILQKLNNYLINYFLIKNVKKINHDLIFFIKAENIYSKTIQKIKNKKNIVVNFYPDNPFVTWNGNSNINVLNSLPFYDCFLIWFEMLMLPLLSAGCKNVYYFPFAYDAEMFRKHVVCEYSNDICFVGTWDKDRENWLTNLINKKQDIKLAIWGNMWDEKLSQYSILRKYIKGEAVYGDDLLKVFSSSKIVLNFIRRQNMTSHNMRTMEVLASKSFLLTQRTKEQAELLFTEGTSIECFSDIDELIKKINFYLTNDVQRNKIVDVGFEKVKEYEIKKQLEKFCKFLIKN